MIRRKFTEKGKDPIPQPKTSIRLLFRWDDSTDTRSVPIFSTSCPNSRELFAIFAFIVILPTPKECWSLLLPRKRQYLRTYPQISMGTQLHQLTFFLVSSTFPCGSTFLDYSKLNKLSFGVEGVKITNEKITHRNLPDELGV